MSFAYNGFADQQIPNQDIPNQGWNTPFNPEISSYGQLDSQGINGIPNSGLAYNTTNYENSDTCDLIEKKLFSGLPPGSKGSFSETSSGSSPSFQVKVPLTNLDVEMLNDTIQQGDTERGMSIEELANKRKAQNRAAQRAFRERKELRLKELEGKLKESETDKAKLRLELENLRKQNIVISTENKLLLQNGSSSTARTIPQPTVPENFSFPTKDKFYYGAVKSEHPKQIPDRVLTIPEVWEYLNNKDDPSLDIEDIMNEIKGTEVCHEHGPAYTLSSIDEIIKQHIGSKK